MRKGLVQGIITVIQKAGKTKGPVENLRPITLLSMLRNIIRICLKKCITTEIDIKIPPSEAAHKFT